MTDQAELDRAHAYRLHPHGHTTAPPWWSESPGCPTPAEWERLPKVCARRRFWLRLIHRNRVAEFRSHCLHGTGTFYDAREMRQCCRCWCLR